MRYFFLIFTLVLSINSYALPTQITCDAKNASDPVDQTGVVKFRFDSFSIIWKGLKNKEIMSQSVVCGREMSNSSTKPTCVFEDQSQNAVHYSFSCNSVYGNGNVAWFSDGNLDINDITKSGRFSCRTKYGNSTLIVLELSSCR